mmetsp:Transcript_31705/g.95253  ORF Transcript_31705/g.95253 Transcript_31705/m.95253 type:complete len:219 (+) Transcript_31705:1227-1883(+)
MKPDKPSAKKTKRKPALEKKSSGTMDGAFLDLFWQLASTAADARKAAALDLVKRLKAAPDAAAAAYALKRLVGGLLSPRDGARAGCACALTALLRDGAVSPAAVVARIEEVRAEPEGSSRSDRKDARARDLAELLAAECLSRAGVADAASATHFCGRALALMASRKWLRELAARCVAGLLEKADAAALADALTEGVGGGGAAADEDGLRWVPVERDAR